MKPVPKHKTALMIWIAIYPTINLVFFLLGDFFGYSAYAAAHPFAHHAACTADGICAAAFAEQAAGQVAARLKIFVGTL